MKKCKHNRIKEKARSQGRFGKNNVYCTQCQKWVNIFVKGSGSD